MLKWHESETESETVSETEYGVQSQRRSQRQGQRQHFASWGPGGAHVEERHPPPSSLSTPWCSAPFAVAEVIGPPACLIPVGCAFEGMLFSLSTRGGFAALGVSRGLILRDVQGAPDLVKADLDTFALP